MGFNKANIQFSDSGKLRFVPLFLLICFILISFSPYSLVFSQDEISIDDQRGSWLDNSSWSDNSNPGISNINDDCIIYGTITRWGDLSFVNGDLIVHDTLLIYGNLNLGIMQI